MENWKNLGQTLEELLRLQTYPLAVKFVKDESEFPEKVRRPEQKIAICQALTISRRWGWTMGVTEDDSGCPGVSLAYGWNKLIDEETLGQFFLTAGYAADETGVQTFMEILEGR